MLNAIHIHVGVHKTGSSFIQHAFFRDRESLLETYGLVYPGATANHGVPLVSIFRQRATPYSGDIRRGIIDPASRGEANVRDRAAFEAALRTTPASDALISGEGLSTLNSIEVRELVDWLERFAHRLEVVALVREHTAWGASAAAQRVKSGKRMEKVVSEPPLNDYREALGPWIEAVGLEAMRVADYRLSMSRPGGVLEFMCESLPVDPSWWAGSDGATRNVSPSEHALRLVSKVNELFPMFVDGDVGPRRFQGDVNWMLNVEGPVFRLPQPVIERLWESAVGDRQWVSETFGIRWLAPEARASEGSGADDDPFVDALVVKIVDLIGQLRAAEIERLLDGRSEDSETARLRSELNRLKAGP